MSEFRQIYWSIDLVAATTDEATIVKAELDAPLAETLGRVGKRISRREFRKAGTAKRYPTDKPDAGVGVLIASVRALEQLTAELRKEIVDQLGFEFK